VTRAEATRAAKRAQLKLPFEEGTLSDYNQEV
jgi:hypothetical protein